jgi:hypothetical protein
MSVRAVVFRDNLRHRWQEDPPCRRSIAAPGRCDGFATPSTATSEHLRNVSVTASAVRGPARRAGHRGQLMRDYSGGWPVIGAGLGRAGRGVLAGATVAGSAATAAE